MAEKRKTQCSCRVFTGERVDFGGHRCSRKGTHVFNGNPYCKLHFPPNVEKRKAEWEKRRITTQAEQDAKWKADEKRKRHANHCVAVHDDLVAALTATKALLDRLAMSPFYELAIWKPADRKVYTLVRDALAAEEKAGNPLDDAR